MFRKTTFSGPLWSIETIFGIIVKTDLVGAAYMVIQ